MPLNIKNIEVERLIDELVAMTGETKTEAVRKALQERSLRVKVQTVEPKHEQLLDFLRNEVWPTVLKDLRGKGISQEVQDEVLGYGPEGLCSWTPQPFWRSS